MQTSGWIQFAIYHRRARADHEAHGALSAAGARCQRQNVARSGAAAAGARDLSSDGRRSRAKSTIGNNTRSPCCYSAWSVVCLPTAILRLQYFLPLNPQGLTALSQHLAFNTAVSFTTNTNWQNYAGESTMSVFLADGRPGVSQFRLRRDWHRYCRCPR